MSQADLRAGTPPAFGRPEEWVVGDPLGRTDWDSLVSARPDSWFFHGSGWARVLRESYGHNPFYISRTAGGQIHDLLPVMEVCSRWTGRRGVSLPFTDFCFPLQSGTQHAQALYRLAMECGRQRHWRYLECRWDSKAWEGSKPSLAFYGHELDLEPGAEAIWRGFSGALRRGIRKAQAAGLQVEFGAGVELIRVYYDLHCRTRRQHGLPPQPFRFFANIQRHMLERGGGFIAIVRFNGKPAGAAAFFCQGRNALYKFGASDKAFLQWRPNNLVMWESIKHCMTLGCYKLHFGRTSLANEGLRRFKLGFGAREERIQYANFDFESGSFVADKDRVEGWFNRVFAWMPLSWLRLAGKLLYPHLS